MGVTVKFRGSHNFPSETDQKQLFQAVILTGPQRGRPGRLFRAPRAYANALSYAARARFHLPADTTTRGSSRGSSGPATLIFDELRSQHRFLAAKGSAQPRVPGPTWSKNQVRQTPRPDTQKIRDGGLAPSLGLCPYQGTTSPLDPAMPPALLVEDRRAPRRLRSTNHNPPAEGDTHFLNRIPTSRPYLPRTAERWRIKTPPTSVARCSVGPPRGGWSYIQKVNKVTVLGLPLIGKKPRLLASKPLAAYKKTKKSFTRSV